MKSRDYSTSVWISRRDHENLFNKYGTPCTCDMVQSTHPTIEPGERAGERASERASKSSGFVVSLHTMPTNTPAHVLASAALGDTYDHRAHCTTQYHSVTAHSGGGFLFCVLQTRLLLRPKSPGTVSTDASVVLTPRCKKQHDNESPSVQAGDSRARDIH